MAAELGKKKNPMYLDTLSFTNILFEYLTFFNRAAIKRN